MFGLNNNSGIERRLKTLENAMLEFSEDLGALKASIMRINAKVAVEAREDKKKKGDFFEDISPQELLKAIIKGEQITKIELDKDGVPVTDSSDKNNIP